MRNNASHVIIHEENVNVCVCEYVCDLHVSHMCMCVYTTPTTDTFSQIRVRDQCLTLLEH